MEREALADWMALYAIDALAESERTQLETSLAEASELSPTLADFQMAVAAIPYSAPPVPLPANLKACLMERITQPTDSQNPTISQNVTISDLIHHASSVTWENYALAPNTQVGKFLVDDQKREIQCFIRATGSVKFPAHRHAQNEELVVLDGDLAINGQVYHKGDRIYSTPGTDHQPMTENGCLLFLRASLDDEILSPEANSTAAYNLDSP